MTRKEAAKLVAIMLAACPAQASKLDAGRAEAMVDAYAALLDDLPYEHGQAALRVLLQTRTWLPSVAEIRTTALELVRGPVAPGAEAWGAVTKAIGKHGAYKRPGEDFTFADPTTAQCVAHMDWRALCLSENPTADRARFIELYDKLARQAQREATSPLLASTRDERAATALPKLSREASETPALKRLDAPGPEFLRAVERDREAVSAMARDLAAKLGADQDAKAKPPGKLLADIASAKSRARLGFVDDPSDDEDGSEQRRLSGAD